MYNESDRKSFSDGGKCQRARLDLPPAYAPRWKRPAESGTWIFLLQKDSDAAPGGIRLPGLLSVAEAHGNTKIQSADTGTIGFCHMRQEERTCAY